MTQATRREDEATGSLTRGGRASWILAIVAHVLAWVVYLPVAAGLVVWPYLLGGRGEDFKVLATVFLPVALTGLALLTVLTSRSNRGISLLAARARFVPLLLFLTAGLGIYSVSQVHLPVGAKLIIVAVIAGIALATVLTVGKIERVVALWVAALLLLGFCVLAGFSVGFLFLPAAFALLSLATVFGLSRTTTPEENCRVP